jgi:hypothetical protein
MNSEQQLRRLSYVGIEPPFPGRGHQALAALLALTVALLPLSANAASVASFIHRVLFLRRQPDGFRKRGSGHGRRRDLSFGLIFGRPHLGRGSFHRSRAGSPQGLRPPRRLLGHRSSEPLQCTSSNWASQGPLLPAPSNPPLPLGSGPSDDCVSSTINSALLRRHQVLKNRSPAGGSIPRLQFPRQPNVDHGQDFSIQGWKCSAFIIDQQKNGGSIQKRRKREF